MRRQAPALTLLALNCRRVARLFRSLAILKPIFGVAITGVVAVLLWKALLVVLLPFIGIAAGFLFLVAKLVLGAVMVCVAIWVLRRLARREEKLA